MIFAGLLALFGPACIAGSADDGASEARQAIEALADEPITVDESLSLTSLAGEIDAALEDIADALEQIENLATEGLPEPEPVPTCEEVGPTDVAAALIAASDIGVVATAFAVPPVMPCPAPLDTDAALDDMIKQAEADLEKARRKLTYGINAGAFPLDVAELKVSAARAEAKLGRLRVEKDLREIAKIANAAEKKLRLAKANEELARLNLLVAKAVREAAEVVRDVTKRGHKVGVRSQAELDAAEERLQEALEKEQKAEAALTAAILARINGIP